MGRQPTQLDTGGDRGLRGHPSHAAPASRAAARRLREQRRRRHICLAQVVHERSPRRRGAPVGPISRYLFRMAAPFCRFASSCSEMITPPAASRAGGSRATSPSGSFSTSMMASARSNSERCVVKRRLRTPGLGSRSSTKRYCLLVQRDEHIVTQVRSTLRGWSPQVIDGRRWRWRFGRRWPTPAVVPSRTDQHVNAAVELALLRRGSTWAPAVWPTIHRRLAHDVTSACGRALIEHDNDEGQQEKARVSSSADLHAARLTLPRNEHWPSRVTAETPQATGLAGAAGHRRCAR